MFGLFPVTNKEEREVNFTPIGKNRKERETLGHLKYVHLVNITCSQSKYSYRQTRDNLLEIFSLLWVARGTAEAHQKQRLAYLQQSIQGKQNMHYFTS